MPTIELIYDQGCPNVAKARAQLLRAFAAADMTPHWSEWQRGEPASPDYANDYGSPTILVAGRDVAGAAPAEGVSSCRIYADASGEMQGVPSVELIASALRSAGQAAGAGARRGRGRGWRSSLASLPGIGAAFLPVGICPACWPAYAGLLSAMGMGALLKTAYLLPLTAGFLLMAVAALAFRARLRRGYGPFVAGLGASAVVLIGKFVFASDAVMIGGIVLLVAASGWNAWPRKAAEGGACSACAPEGQTSHSQSPGANEVSS